MTINADQVRKVSAQFDESASAAGSLILAAALAGDGLKFTTTEGAMGVEPADFAGTGLEDDGSDNLQIDTGSTVDFSSDTPVWTFGNETTGEGLFVSGTPIDGDHVVNKTYVDGLVTGLTWKDPVCTLGLVGNADVSTINGLSPSAGDAYVVTDTGSLTLGTVAVTAGDLVEFDGTDWVLLEDATGGFVNSGVRAALSTTVALISPYTDATDDGKIVSFSGSSNTGTATGDAVDGNAVLVDCDGAYYENTGWVFDGSTPSGTWTQFAGGSNPSAGTGLSYSGNTLNVGAGNGIQVGSTTVALDLDNGAERNSAGGASVANNPIYLDASNGLNIMVDGTTIDLDSSNDYRLYIPAGGISGSQLGSDSVSIDKLDFEWEVIDVPASSFSFSATRSTFTLTDAALSDAAIDDSFILMRNGVDDQTLAGTTAASNEWSISGTTLSVHDDITGSLDTYRLRYLIAHP
jgi:hypothetical protein